MKKSDPSGVQNKSSPAKFPSPRNWKNNLLTIAMLAAGGSCVVKRSIVPIRWPSGLPTADYLRSKGRAGRATVPDVHVRPANASLR